MFKYFFWNKISQSLILAVVTHNPFVPLLMIYIMSIAWQEPSLNIPQVITIFLFWMPYLAWEFARKIRAPQEETDYTTYSKLVGAKGACLLFLGTSFLTIFLSFFLVLFYINDFRAWIPVILMLAYHVKLSLQTLKFLKESTPHPSGFKKEMEEFIAVVFFSWSIVGFWMTFTN